MKKILIFITMILFSSFANAYDYSKLWKQYDKAFEEDMPKDQLAVLRKISDKAQHNKDYGHMIKAESLTLQASQMLSDDSLTLQMNRILALKDKAEEGNDEALKAVWNVIVGKAYATFHPDWTKRIEYDAISESCLQRAMAHPEALAVECKPYEAILTKGKDHGIFLNDLLSIIAYETQSMDTALDFYREHGNTEAACALDWLLAERSYASYKKIDELIGQYPNTSLTKRMQTRRQQLYEEWTQPNLTVVVEQTSLIPGEDIVVNLTYRNIDYVTIELTRLNVTGKEAKSLNITKLLQRKQKEATRILKHDTKYKELHDTKSEEVTVKGLPAGVYVIEFRSPEIKPEDNHKGVLYVSDNYILTEPYNNGMRIVVANATTGRPISGASVSVQRRYGNKETQNLTTDSNGECKYETKGTGNYTVWAETQSDKFMCPDIASSFYYTGKKSKAVDRVNIYTDRSIYRPGQKIMASLLAYNQNGDQINVVKDKSVEVTLKDPQYETIQSLTVQTDSMGVARMEFDIPADCRTGMFNISTAYINSACRVRVEEYKRPTFEVTIEKPDYAYANGDTIIVKGRAKTYSGTAVAGAKVHYTVNRKTALWWRRWAIDIYDNDYELANASATTDETGCFEMKVPMLLGYVESWRKHFCNISISADVTDNTGEVHNAELSLPLSNRTAVLTCDLGSQILTDEVKNMTFKLLNNAGETISAKTVKYNIDNGKWQTTTTDTSTPLPVTTSGRHVLTAVCEGDTLEQKFTLFSLTDKVCAVDTLEWFYASSDVFDLEHNKPVIIQAGASEDVHIFYTIHTSGKVIEHGSWQSGGKLKRFELTYKPEYGDGILVDVAWVWRGKLYKNSCTVSKPQPQKNLKMEWKTFRDKTQPGSHETWSLQLLTRDGKPATANLMAVMFDKSLDALAKHHWALKTYFQRILPTVNWDGMSNSKMYAYGTKPLKQYNMLTPELTRFVDDLFVGNYRSRVKIRGRKSSGDDVYYALDAAPMPMVEKMAEPKAAIGSFDVKANDENYVVGYGVLKTEESNDNAEEIEIRSDFAETAFFMPQLHTDANGIVTIDFDLPESVTTWRLMALAHTEALDYVTGERECIAQKPVMVQAHMPRFLRLGDKAVISARIAQTEADKSHKGTATLTLLDAATMQTVSTDAKPFALNGAETTVHFDVTPKDDTDLICRITVKGDGFSDGEQHLLPVLSDREKVIYTRPFTLNDKDTISITMPISDATLSIEYCANPTKLVVQALPDLTKTESHNSIDVMTTIYASTLQNILLQAGITTGKGDADSLKAITNSSIEKLKNMQLPDGSWPWFEGMNGNSYITLSVAKMMARLICMTGGDVSQVSKMFDKTLTFLDNQVDKDVKEMKKDKATYLPSSLLDYLYICAITKHGMKADKAYLIKLMKNQKLVQDIYQKALSAQILFHNGNITEAKKYAESIRQHTVFTNEMGRYFDTGRAPYSWCDYRIPTQVAAIEALTLISPLDVKTADEMRLWLLQEKRTTSWDTPINSTDAVYAFFLHNEGEEQVANATTKWLSRESHATIIYDGQQIDTRDFATNGSTQLNSTHSTNSTITIAKSDEGPSWGAIYAEADLKASEVVADGSGMTIKREIIRTADNRATVRITITAERDYDFVEIVDRRPACLEPVQQLSGYVYSGNIFCRILKGSGAYVECRDSETRYYIDKMHKGTHQYETDYYIEREGSYNSGTATIKCAYAPAFRAVVPAIKM